MIAKNGTIEQHLKELPKAIVQMTVAKCICIVERDPPLSLSKPKLGHRFYSGRHKSSVSIDLLCIRFSSI